MSPRSRALALKRQQLIVDAAVQRVELAYFTEGLSGPIAVADGVVDAIDTARRHPLMLAVGFGFLLALSRRRVVGIAGRGWGLWRLYRLVSGSRGRRSVLSALASRFTRF